MFKKLITGCKFRVNRQKVNMFGCTTSLVNRLKMHQLVLLCRCL